MKHLRLFPNAQVRNSVLADIDYKILSKTDGEPGVGIYKGTWVNPKTIPFYVENITQEAETLTITEYFGGEQTGYFGIPVEYSIDGTNWSPLGTTGANQLTRKLEPGDKVYLRATANTWCEKQQELYIDHGCKINGVSKVGGNIMSLLYGNHFNGNETEFPSGSNQNFAYIFTNREYDYTQDNDVLTDASELILPATILTENCYANMFRDCLSLTTAPDLPATTLAEWCYYSMFHSCRALTTAPTLPATTLAEHCYEEMFMYCSSLKAAPTLPATTLADSCYICMFDGCTLLTAAPALPATTLARSCYGSMFNGCTLLTAAPALPAITLANGCYNSMFSGCRALTTAPELPATTLTEGCYMGMFQRCSSLTNAPVLRATTLTTACYYNMFNSCSNLNYIKCLATDISVSNCTGNWVIGIAANGTFVKDPNTNWPTGTSGIPEGWTVQGAA